MSRKLPLVTLGIAAASIGAAQTPTFGIRVPIGGEATDLALDQPRGVLYIANFTANRIDRMNLATFQLEAPIHGRPEPGCHVAVPGHALGCWWRITTIRRPEQPPIII